MHEHASSRRLALSATLHCLTGCGIGEVLGLVIADALGWSTAPAIALAVVLAFLFGYSLTLRPLFKAGVALGTALGIAFAVDTLSITVMEIVDNAIILIIPGAMEAGIGSMLFWGSLAFALAVAFVAAYPVNYWLLARGRGHALMHEYH
jgi:putative flippase GtrA